MKTLALVLCLAVCAYCIPDDEWNHFKGKHGKNYTSEEEEQKRYSHFKANKAAIDKHNKEFDAGNVGYSLGVNEFTDMPNDEFRKQRNGFRSANKKARYVEESNAHLRVRALPASLNWTAQGYVTPVKDQGQCGSCWTFSTTGALEGQHFRTTGQLVSLSEQNILDCDTYDGGCNGGAMQNAMIYIANNKGIDTEASYPYTAVKGTCHYNASNKAAIDYGYYSIPAGNETALQIALASVGPISVAIDASHPSFQSYKSGIYSEPLCNVSLIDHAVLLVGYGMNGSSPYWLLKNSWGTGWGMSGYFMLARNMNNKCGIASDACYPYCNPTC